MFKSIVALFFVAHFHYRKDFHMEVIKFSLDLSDFDRQDWEEDIESTALWLYDFLSRDSRYNRNHEFDKVKDFDFAYTINNRYRRAVVFIKSEAPRRNLRVFQWYWEGKLEHKRPFAVIPDWGRIPLNVGHYVLKNGKAA